MRRKAHSKQRTLPMCDKITTPSLSTAAKQEHIASKNILGRRREGAALKAMLDPCRGVSYKTANGIPIYLAIGRSSSRRRGNKICTHPLIQVTERRMCAGISPFCANGYGERIVDIIARVTCLHLPKHSPREQASIKRPHGCWLIRRFNLKDKSLMEAMGS
ncbi:hypothetical protein SISNIDRAFT_67105 [Sistotremastrum niveocremeum HHB9708]|uniref:Uncharacterized protein n=1 Tax=Sistotremastrum niveocremeum HHB9708 TaxID=1314777 RepID=A0A164V135_9AGAM|nr:hypothetical protein SISNIDRAFT_67105 [Sistotremastrum niveocremeum HHB9708]